MDFVGVWCGLCGCVVDETGWKVGGEICGCGVWDG